jgi:hypothetical protein
MIRPKRLPLMVPTYRLAPCYLNMRPSDDCLIVCVTDLTVYCGRVHIYPVLLP